VIFASKAFFLFLPAVLLGYHLLRRRSHKYTFLLLASWLFYASISPQYLWVILLLTAIDYVVGLRIERSTDDRARKWWLTASVVSNLGLLISFKYTTFVYDNVAELGHLLGWPIPARVTDSGVLWDILLPLGISFHTFQGISYTVDVYRGNLRAVTSFRDYALFVAFFPQLAAGPIVRAVEFLPQMVTPPPVSERQVADGIVLFTFGLFKKLVIADNLDALFVSPVFHSPGAFDAGTLRWAAVAWAVQIYCDFSGYTDMALGTAKWFGFELPPNFRLPYLATSITDFWRRWHLSLSTWLRDYLYFPMGGSRGSALRTYFNLMVLFILCGLWHGASWNWLAYGVANGVLMCLHRLFDRAVSGIRWADVVRRSTPWLILAWLATAFQFLLTLVLIRTDGLASAWQIMDALAGWAWRPGTLSAAGLDDWFVGVPTAVGILLVLGMSGHIVGILKGLGLTALDRPPEALRMAAAAVALAGVVVFSPGVARSFIYIQF
jgi:alginate O-acetyltransferase complex protein AlgI